MLVGEGEEGIIRECTGKRELLNGSFYEARVCTCGSRAQRTR